jgi:hypothetical protein
METMLFTTDSLWTMVHGIVLGGGAMLGLAASLFAMRTLAFSSGDGFGADRQARELGWLLVALAVGLWLAVIVGTYIVFPPYRATPPEGLTDLSQYPRALIRATPGFGWLHSYAMETKEHVPWIAGMLATAAAFIGVRYKTAVLRDVQLRNMVMALLAICFVLVSYVSLLGVFVNKAAPLE